MLTTHFYGITQATLASLPAAIVGDFRVKGIPSSHSFEGKIPDFGIGALASVQLSSDWKRFEILPAPKYHRLLQLPAQAKRAE